MKNYWLMIIVGISISLPSFASLDETKTTSLLERISQKIYLLKQKLSEDSHQKETLRSGLEEDESHIHQLSQKIVLTKKQLAEQSSQLKKIKNEQKKNKEDLKNQLDLLEKQIQKAYELGRQPFLKILLNQQDPEKINRYLYYYQYLNDARKKNIDHIKILVTKITASEIYIKKQTNILQQAEKEQTKRHLALKHQKGEKQRLLGIVNQNIEKKRNQLQNLYADKKRLQGLIVQIRREKLYEASGVNFVQAKKRLIWPVEGIIIQRFGQPLVDGRLPSTGILIQPKTSTAVRAVFSGKIVYAQWLNGFGLLVIIQHGQNYLTLYGNNDYINVQLGELVKTGQVIATIKNNKNDEKFKALYFEIRHREKPENPLLWLKKIS